MVRDRTQLMRMTRDDLVALLKAAERAIAAILADEPSEAERWSLPRLQADIRRVLAEFGDRGGARITAAAGEAWRHGQDLVDRPLEAALPEARITAGLRLLDGTQLVSLRTFMVDRIRNIGVEAGNRIAAELGLVAIGARSPSEAVGAVKRILGESSRARATTIVRTELGRAFAAAAQARMTQAAKVLPADAPLKKRWLRSGKLRPRLHHLLAHGQVRAVGEKFELKPLGGAPVYLMFPHDPAAPPEETINCGCVAVPHLDFRAPGMRLLTRAEHLRRQGLPADPEPIGLEDDGETLRQILERQQREREPA